MPGSGGPRRFPRWAIGSASSPALPWPPASPAEAVRPASEFWCLWSVEYLPGLVFGIVGGVLADRWNRKITMLVADLGRASAGCRLGLRRQLPRAFRSDLRHRALSMVRQPAREAVVPHLIPGTPPPRRQRSVFAQQLRNGPDRLGDLCGIERDRVAAAPLRHIWPVDRRRLRIRRRHLPVVRPDRLVHPRYPRSSYPSPVAPEESSTSGHRCGTSVRGSGL